jgi:uncharacterized protein YbaA (DUF1428 family)
MYVDGVVAPVPESNIEAYRIHSEKFGRAVMKLGAIQYVEAIGDDLKEGKWTDFYRAVDRKPGETVAFAWVMFPSKEIRDAAWAKMMADPEMMKEMGEMPFDGKRMIFGGFAPIVEFGKPA